MISQFQVLQSPKDAISSLEESVAKQAFHLTDYVGHKAFDTMRAGSLLGFLFGVADNSKLVTFVEFGCGSGWFSRKVGTEKAHIQLTGYDSNPRSIWSAKNVHGSLPNVAYVHKNCDEPIDLSQTEVLYYHRACGSLPDYALEQGVQNKVPIIAGLGCCYNELRTKDVPYERDLFEFVTLLMQSMPRKEQREFMQMQDESMKHPNPSRPEPLTCLYNSEPVRRFITLQRAAYLADNKYFVGLDATGEVLVGFSQDTPNLFK